MLSISVFLIARMVLDDITIQNHGIVFSSCGIKVHGDRIVVPANYDVTFYISTDNLKQLKVKKLTNIYRTVLLIFGLCSHVCRAMLTQVGISNLLINNASSVTLESNYNNTN